MRHVGRNVRASGRKVASRWRSHVGAFAAAVAVAAMVLALSPPAGMAQTCQPQVGAQGTAPFTVWYCAGDATGQQKAATVAQLLDQVWPQMTLAEPNGLGPPVAPEANDGRLSVYVTAPTAEVVFGECPDECDSVGDFFGRADPAPPFIVNASGAERSSGVLLINEDKGVNDATVIHEFFHVLEFAHSAQGGESWLSEAMGVWAEHHYRATETVEERTGYFEAFQGSPGSSLFARGGNLEYGAYVWPVWLAQSTDSASSVFRMWTALSSAKSDSAAAIDSVVDAYLTRLGLGFESSFKDFAVEDLNLDLSPRVTPQLFSRGTFGDPAVPLGLTPPFVRRPWTLATRSRTTPVNLSELSMQYDHVRAISRSVGAVSVRSSGIAPWGDVVVLARAATGWQRVDLVNGSVTFCRFTRRGNVGELFVIADNHDRHGAHSGSYTVRGRTTCPSRRSVTRTAAPA
jgi:hypothetical protein